MKTGCPYCVHLKLCPHNNLLALYPKICEEWDYDKNKKPPENYSKGSDEKVWWLCPKSHSWICVIHNRTNKVNQTCPKCNSGKFSKKQIKWLNFIAETCGIDVQNALSPEGEYKIKYKNYKYELDGFTTIDEFKICFEFDGCYWHGCEFCFDQNDQNDVNCKTFRELKENTERKHDNIIKAGYYLVSIRECTYEEIFRNENLVEEYKKYIKWLLFENIGRYDRYLKSTKK
jgi:hypothetical protein